MSTFIPAFILAMLGNPPIGEVRTQIEPQANVICWSAPERVGPVISDNPVAGSYPSGGRAVCFGYADEGTHLVVHLNEEQ